jgi:hypothetical protein
MLSLVALPFALFFVYFASRNFESESASVVARAVALGEEVEQA